MKRPKTLTNSIFRLPYICLFFIVSFSLYSCEKEQGRFIENFNNDWKFFLGDAQGAEEILFDDSNWRILNLPHDWSIEGKFSEDHPATPAGGALPTGIAWYRKTFELSSKLKNKLVFIDFDGIYRNSEVWINGHYLGIRPNGYSSFRYELTPLLKYGQEENIISVRIDNSAQPNSRWYTGSGIYRNVRLVTTGRLYVDQWGTFVTTPFVTDDSAVVKLDIRLRNHEDYSGKVKVKTVIYNDEGNEVTRGIIAFQSYNDSIIDISQEFNVRRPILWSVENPYMYKAVTRIYKRKRLTDSYETPFGIRYFEFDTMKGFLLNGKHVKILGVCNHHDLGALGAAVNKRAIERQLEILKEMGCNGIRTAHNPPAPELLNLCDKMGFIVMDEAFDVWEKRKVSQDYHVDWDEWHKIDLRDLIRRDRNHPSVFMWSIGNEIREQFDSTGITITRELVKIVKDIDPTRPVTCALTENDPDKNFIYRSGALDLLAFNYKQDAYIGFPLTYPGEKFIASETTSALQTRSHYNMPSDSICRWPRDWRKPFTEGNPDFTGSAYDNISAYWGSTHEETWKIIKKYDYLSGLFIWTGFDYLGEPTPYPWPARSSYFGIVDLAGFPKDAYYMYQSEWTDTPVLHLFPHWNWEPGETVDVWAYFNHADEVELFLNGESKGIRKKQGDDLHVMWRVKYIPGIIKAVSRKNDSTVLTHEINTAGKPARIGLETDRNTICADGKDLSFITVKILDEDGNLVPYADNLIKFSLSGEGRIVGVDNGYQASLEQFKSDQRKAFNGLCLVIIQSNEKGGEITLKANGDGLHPGSIIIYSK